MIAMRRLSDFVWERVLIGLVGSQIDFEDHVNGTVFQRRSKIDRISLWLRGDLTKEQVLGAGRRLRQFIEGASRFDKRVPMQFEPFSRNHESNVKALADVVPLKSGFPIHTIKALADNTEIEGIRGDAFE